MTNNEKLTKFMKKHDLSRAEIAWLLSISLDSVHNWFKSAPTPVPNWAIAFLNKREKWGDFDAP